MNHDAEAMGRPAPRLPPPLIQAEAPVEARLCDTPEGTLWAAHTLYGDSYRHGRGVVGAARAWDAIGLARLAREPRAANLELERWAFLDVETTGLGMFAGTYAFLVGIGWMDAAGFHVEQLLMRDPDDELALLHATSQRLAGFAGVLTFNGKTFDLPLLATRAALARRPAPHAALVHCDVLHASRRAFRQPGETCGLQALEARLLDVRRQGDLEGRFIPQVYQDYLRGASAARLDPILAHNRRDLVSLLLLASESGRFLEQALRGRSDASDPNELAASRLRAAHVLWQEGEVDLAAPLLEACLGGATSSGTRVAARSLLAYIRKRQGNLNSACRLWEEMLREDPSLVEPVEELAKVHEHRWRDVTAALALVDQRLNGADLDPVTEAALRHRRDRLRRKGASAAGFLADRGLGIPEALSFQPTPVPERHA